MQKITQEQQNKLITHIKHINPKNKDYYQWGINTRIVVGDDLETAQNIINLDHYIDTDKLNLFWEGYWYGIEIILQIAENAP